MLQNLIVRMTQSGAFVSEASNESERLHIITKFLDEEQSQTAQRRAEVEADSDAIGVLAGDEILCAMTSM